MNKEQQRIKIAEACGWTDCHMPAASNQTMPFTERVLCGIAPGRRIHSPLPDYLSDLNAMHEAEKIMSAEQCDAYERRLGNTVNRPWHATAAQRAEAFLRTLNLWEETQ